MRTNLLGAGSIISSPQQEKAPETLENQPETEGSAEAAKTPHARNEMANALRFLAVDAVEKAKSGHPGMPLGVADILTTLWTKCIRFDPNAPDWIDRDRFILSAGHGSAALYALLYLVGTEGVTLEDIKGFRQLDSRTPGHPERGCLPGVEVTTGPLGQGVAMGVGMAIAERQLNEQYSDDIFEHHTYILASDGDLMEGISAEAASLAGHLKLGRLIVLYDSNSISIDGATRLSDSSNPAQRFESFNWQVQEIDGHNHPEIEAAILEAQKSVKPSLIICKTKIGFGAPTKEGTAASHGAPLGKDELQATRDALQWKNEPFDIPANILDEWRIAGLNMAKKHGAWKQRWSKLNSEPKSEISRRFAQELPDSLGRTLSAVKRTLAKGTAFATRKASGEVLEILAQNLPELIGGSADLTESNNTKGATQTIFTSDHYEGQYIHYGVREHAMAAAINGMAAHGGFIPYGGTFLIFSDYCRPALRLAALMKLQSIFVFSHDSIGLGEDGPTHQPVEQLAALRAIPNFNVFRPADNVETLECWEVALKQKNTPSAMLLSRQTLPILRGGISEENRSRRGAYEIRGVDGNEDITLIASGSEVKLAMDISRRLYNRRVAARVVSAPCLDLFAAQSSEYRASVLGTSSLRIIIEAASNSNWHDVVGDGCHFIGMNSFGASGTGEAVFKKFGFDEEVISKKIIELVKQKKLKEKREEI